MIGARGGIREWFVRPSLRGELMSTVDAPYALERADTGGV